VRDIYPKHGQLSLNTETGGTYCAVSHAWTVDGPVDGFDRRAETPSRVPNRGVFARGSGSWY
jgi:hypothetical protein